MCPLLDEPAAGTREQNKVRETRPQRPPQIWSRAPRPWCQPHAGPRRPPLPGWRQDPLASWARSPAPAHGGARGEVMAGNGSVQPQMPLIRGASPSRRSVLDPVHVAQDCQLVPRTQPQARCVSMAPGPAKVRKEGAEGPGVKHRPPRLRSRALRPRRRSCPGLQRALPSPLTAFHGPSVTAP